MTTPYREDLKIKQLEEWLKKAISAIPHDQRVIKKLIEVDEAAGSTWEEDLKPWIREALVAIGENPDSYY